MRNRGHLKIKLATVIPLEFETLPLHFYCHIPPPISVYFLSILYIVVLVLHFYCHIPPPISVYFLSIIYMYIVLVLHFFLSHSSPISVYFLSIIYIVVLVLHFYCHITPPISVYFLFFIYYLYRCTCSHLEYVWYICCLMLCNQKPINRLRIAQLIATL